MKRNKILSNTFFIITFILSPYLCAQDPTATAPSGSGSSGDPYQIESLNNLYWITQNPSSWGSYFEQTTNIDVSSSSSWDSGAGLSPIGNTSTKFTGNYNGMENTISNLTISRSSTHYIGLFGYIDGATITTLILSNCDITGNTEVGALVGYSDNSSTITGGTSSGTVTGTSRVGGLVGDNDGSSISMSYSSCTVSGGTAGGLVGLNHTSASITSSYATGNVSGSSTVGGLVGENANSATISQCNATATVTASGQYIGGFAGTNKSTINKSYSTGSTTGASETGGFVGENYNSEATIDDCYSRGNVTRASGSSNTNIGGFIGRSTVGSPAIDNCYSTGSVDYAGATNPTDKGFCGNLSAGSINNSFWDSQTSSQSSSSGGTGKTTTEMNTASTFTDAGWSTDTWNIDSGTNDNYPYLDWQNTGGTPLPVEITFFSVVKIDDGIFLEWITATEVNNYGFEIERALSTTMPVQGWMKIGFVHGYGNCNSPKVYEFLDEQPPTGKIQYRLKQIDYDGKYEYSDVVEVNVDAPTRFALEQNYPNPFNPTTAISYQIPRDEYLTLKIFDILGREVAVLVEKHETAGTHKIELDASNLPSGLYIYQIQAGKFIHAKKMLLIK